MNRLPYNPTDHENVLLCVPQSSLLSDTLAPSELTPPQHPGTIRAHSSPIPWHHQSSLLSDTLAPSDQLAISASCWPNQCYSSFPTLLNSSIGDLIPWPFVAYNNIYFKLFYYPFAFHLINKQLVTVADHHSAIADCHWTHPTENRTPLSFVRSHYALSNLSVHCIIVHSLFTLLINN